MLSKRPVVCEQCSGMAEGTAGAPSGSGWCAGYPGDAVLSLREPSWRCPASRGQAWLQNWGHHRALEMQGVAGCRWKSWMRMLGFVTAVSFGLRFTWERCAGRAQIEEVGEEYAEVDSQL